MARAGYQCEGCKGFTRIRSYIWDCPGCEKECCDSCAWRYGHCKSCSAGKTDEQLHLAANFKGADFDPPSEEA